MSSGLEEMGIVDDDLSSEAVTTDPGPALDQDNQELVGVDVAAALEKIELFAGLLPIHLERIAELAEHINLRKGDYVFRHDDEADGLYLVVQGTIRISRSTGLGEEALAILRENDHFGEMSLIDDANRSADAIAHESSHLIRLPKSPLRDLMFVDRELAYELLWRFVRTLSLRLRDSNERLMMLSASSKFA